MELQSTLALLGQKFEPSLAGFDICVAFGSGFREIEQCFFHPQFEPGQNISFVNDVASVDGNLLEHAGNWRGQLDF